ncbi:MAG: VWA domain-containing protein [Methylacidiphilales bacterium]|nr:VWA domain-containing protein [Candidatus Methylacidiphilales bacterium]MDW8348711.1 vWA domain-containing protein [Verrucomicrobiae bacterium]
MPDTLSSPPPTYTDQTNSGNLKVVKRSLLATVILVSIAIHIAGGIIATVIIVARYFAQPEATFVAKKPVAIPPKIIEQRMISAEVDSFIEKPVFDDRLASLRPTDFALPEIPPIPIDEITPIDPTKLLTDPNQMIGTAERSTPDDLGFEGDTMSFFGIQDKGRSVVFVLDVSSTMFDRLPGAYKFVQEECINLINNVSINTRFGLVIFSGAAGKWQSELVPATDANKQAAAEAIRKIDRDTIMRIMRDWKDPIREAPRETRPDLGLKLAYTMRPEVIYILTDGEANKKGNTIPITADEIKDVIKQLNETVETPPRIHAVYYITAKAKPREEEFVKAIASTGNGRFIKLEAVKLMREEMRQE